MGNYQISWRHGLIDGSRGAPGQIFFTAQGLQGIQVGPVVDKRAETWYPTSPCRDSTAKGISAWATDARIAAAKGGIVAFSVVPWQTEAQKILMRPDLRAMIAIWGALTIISFF